MNKPSNSTINEQLIRNNSEVELSCDQQTDQIKQGRKNKKGCFCRIFCCFCCCDQSDEESEKVIQLKNKNKQLKHELDQFKSQQKKQQSQSKEIQTDQIQKTDNETFMTSITLKIQKLSDTFIINNKKKNKQPLQIELQILSQSHLLSKNTEQNLQNQTINQQTFLIPQQYEQHLYNQSTSVGYQNQIQLNTLKFQQQGDKQFQSPSQTSQSSNSTSGIYNQISSGSVSQDKSQQKNYKIKILSQQNNNQQQFLSNSQPQSNIYYDQQRDNLQMYQHQNISLHFSQNSNSNSAKSQPVSLINSQNYNNFNQEVYQQKQYNAVAQNSDQIIDSQIPKKQNYQIQQILENSKSSLQNSPRDLLDVLSTQIILSNCFYCQNAIYESSIQTKCQHYYHDGCFAEMIKLQVFSQKLPYIKCLCNQKLSQNILSQIDLKQQNFTKQQIFQNQLQQICLNIQQQGILIKYCENNCNFFYISKGGQSSICLNCIK